MAFSIWYSVPYWAILTLYMVLTIIEWRNSGDKRILQFIRIISTVAFLAFFGLRAYVGYDCHVYYAIYEELVPIFKEGYTDNWSNPWYEPGFICYASVVKWISGDYSVFVFISATIDIIILNSFFKRYSTNYAFGFLVLLTMHPVMEIELMRNVKSLMLFLLAVPYIAQRRFWPFALLMALAFTFHTSTIFLFPLFFFVHKPMPKKVFIILFILCNALYLSQIDFLKPAIQAAANLLGGKYAPMTELYLESDLYGANRGISIGYIERFVTSLLIIAYYNKLLTQKQSNVIFINMFGIFLVVVLVFNGISIIAERVGLLFLVSYWILWPALFCCFQRMSNRILFFGCICLYASLRITSITSNAIYKYENIVFQHDSQLERELVKERYAGDIVGN